MKFYAIVFIVLGISVIIFPELIWILVWSFFIFVWLNMLFFFNFLNNSKFQKSDSYVKWWKYKIFK
jgi:hypothetical protein